MNSESKKQAAPGRREPDQGRETTRQAHITPEPPHIQDRAAQRAKLLGMLRRGPVSPLEARAVGIMHPGGRIFELREAGYQIHTCSSDIRVGVYYLFEPPRRPRP